MPPIESVLLAVTRVSTFHGTTAMTNATGFFYENNGKLWLVTSRHVFIDEPSNHRPDRIEIYLHTDPANVAQTVGFSIPLYTGGKSAWRQAFDRSGECDVAAIELDRAAFPPTTALRAFTPQHLDPLGPVELDTPLLVVGFPLGFHDTLHHMPVARQAGIASSYGLRFKGQGYFLTDARTHRGISGAPVVMRRPVPHPDDNDLPWVLLGIHSARLDVGTRDMKLDEALGLNCSWYADILLTLTA